MHTRKATLADTADMATVSSTAMLDDELFTWLCPGRREYLSDFRYAILRRSKARILRGGDIFVMVTDEDDAEWDGSERVVGHISMIDHGKDAGIPSLWDRFNLTLHGLEDTVLFYLKSDRSIDYGNLAIFEKHLASDDTPLKPYEGDLEIRHLAVDVDFQRRGIGQKLVKVAQEFSTDRGRPLFLVASGKGKGMYAKCGFDNVGQLACEGVVGPCMVWRPAS